MAVAQHGVAVAEAKDLVQPMSDKDDRQALGPKRPDDANEVGDFRLAQGRGRLVHDDEPRLHGERPGDLDQLLLGDREIANQCHWVAFETNFVGDRAGVVGEAPPADEEPRARFPTDEHVLGDRHLRDEGELLVDGDDAGALGVVGRPEGDRLAEQLDFTRVRALRAGQDLEQSRLTGPVLAQERVDLGLPHFETDVLKRQHAREALA